MSGFQWCPLYEPRYLTCTCTLCVPAGPGRTDFRQTFDVGRALIGYGIAQHFMDWMASKCNCPPCSWTPPQKRQDALRV